MSAIIFLQFLLMQSLYLTIMNAHFISKYKRSIFKHHITDQMVLPLYKMNSQLTFVRYADSQLFTKNVVKYYISTMKHTSFPRMQSTVNTNEK